jgi:predicted nucleotidyltransferase
MTIRKTIKNESEGIFTPCKYSLENPSDNEPVELLSYRGKFTEQVKKGELIEARGTLEKVWDKNKEAYRLVLGRKGDYLLPVRLLDE